MSHFAPATSITQTTTDDVTVTVTFNPRKPIALLDAAILRLLTYRLDYDAALHGRDDEARTHVATPEPLRQRVTRLLHALASILP